MTIISKENLLFWHSYGLNPSQIARKYEVSRQSVHFRLQRLGRIKKPPVTDSSWPVLFLRRLGFSHGEIADLAKITIVEVRRILSRNRKWKYRSYLGYNYLMRGE